MAKAGMRRPDPRNPYGTESKPQDHIPKMTSLRGAGDSGQGETTKEKPNPLPRNNPRYQEPTAL